MEWLADNLHIYLKRYKVIQVIIIFFFMWLGWEQWEYYKVNQSLMKEWALAGFVSMNATTLAAIQVSLKSINTRHEADD